jgi:hypothetical protein
MRRPARPSVATIARRPSPLKSERASISSSPAASSSEWNSSTSRNVRFGRTRFRNRAERPPTRTRVEVDAGRFDLDEDLTSLWSRGSSLFQAEHLRATIARRCDDSHR